MRINLNILNKVIVLFILNVVFQSCDGFLGFGNELDYK